MPVFTSACFEFMSVGEDGLSSMCTKMMMGKKKSKSRMADNTCSPVCVLIVMKNNQVTTGAVVY